MRSESVLERGPESGEVVFEFTLSVFLAENLLTDILPVTGCYMLMRYRNLFRSGTADTLITPVACTGYH